MYVSVVLKGLQVSSSPELGIRGSEKGLVHLSESCHAAKVTHEGHACGQYLTETFQP